MIASGLLVDYGPNDEIFGNSSPVLRTRAALTCGDYFAHKFNCPAFLGIPVSRTETGAGQTRRQVRAAGSWLLTAADLEIRHVPQLMG